MLREQFPEGVWDASLHKKIKRCVRDHPKMNFSQIREKVQYWEYEEGATPARKARSREVEHKRSWSVKNTKVALAVKR